jgi:hypothetical protein
MDYLLPLNQSNNFPLIDENWPTNISNNRLQKYKHKLYNFTFCHDFIYNPNNSDIKSVIDKYNRRIERFNIIMKDQNIKKIILYIGKKKNDINLENVLKTLNFTNFEIKSKLYSEMTIDTMPIDWKRNNFDWLKWITL